jgi:hypothetical protein
MTEEEFRKTASIVLQELKGEESKLIRLPQENDVSETISLRELSKNLMPERDRTYIASLDKAMEESVTKII